MFFFDIVFQIVDIISVHFFFTSDTFNNCSNFLLFYRLLYFDIVHSTLLSAAKCFLGDFVFSRYGNIDYDSLMLTGTGVLFDSVFLIL